jgi:hypothetical protein
MEKIDSNQFVFNENLNAAFLGELFEGDSQYAETVFEDFLRDIPVYWERVESAYKNRNLSLLKTCIHTCKTLFGYVGFTNLQEDCQLFEETCADKSDDDLQADFIVLSQKKDQARIVIEEDFKRLKIFNETHT